MGVTIELGQMERELLDILVQEGHVGVCTLEWNRTRPTGERSTRHTCAMRLHTYVYIRVQSN